MPTIAATVGLPEPRVRQILRRAGVFKPDRDRGGVHPRLAGERAKLAAALADELVDRFNAGATLEGLADEVGVRRKKLGGIQRQTGRMDLRASTDSRTGARWCGRDEMAQPYATSRRCSASSVAG